MALLFIPKLLRGYFPAFLYRVGDSDAALFGHLEARLVRHFLALGVQTPLQPLISNFKCQ